MAGVAPNFSVDIQSDNHSKKYFMEGFNNLS